MISNLFYNLKECAVFIYANKNNKQSWTIWKSKISRCESLIIYNISQCILCFDYLNFIVSQLLLFLSSIPIWHWSPSYPGKHWHLYLFIRSLQLPWIHGELWHSSTSKRHQKHQPPFKLIKLSVMNPISVNPTLTWK